MGWNNKQTDGQGGPGPATHDSGPTGTPTSLPGALLPTSSHTSQYFLRRERISACQTLFLLPPTPEAKPHEDQGGKAAWASTPTPMCMCGHVSSPAGTQQGSNQLYLCNDHNLLTCEHQNIFFRIALLKGLFGFASVAPK